MPRRLSERTLSLLIVVVLLVVSRLLLLIVPFSCICRSCDCDCELFVVLVLLVVLVIVFAVFSRRSYLSSFFLCAIIEGDFIRPGQSNDY